MLLETECDWWTTCSRSVPPAACRGRRSRRSWLIFAEPDVGNLHPQVKACGRALVRKTIIQEIALLQHASSSLEGCHRSDSVKSTSNPRCGRNRPLDKPVCLFPPRRPKRWLVGSRTFSRRWLPLWAKLEGRTRWKKCLVPRRKRSTTTLSIAASDWEVTRKCSVSCGLVANSREPWRHLLTLPSESWIW